MNPFKKENLFHTVVFAGALINGIVILLILALYVF